MRKKKQQLFQNYMRQKDVHKKYYKRKEWIEKNLKIETEQYR